MLGAPITTLLVVAGLLFLLIAVVGNVAGRIEPGRTGRVASGVIGAVLLTIGLSLTAFRLDDRAERERKEAAAKEPEDKRRQLEAEAKAKAQALEKRRQAEAEEKRRQAEEQRRAEQAKLAEEARLAGTVPIPNLVGMNIREAEAILSRNGLRSSGRPQYDGRSALGTVLRQMPAAGQRVRPDAIVTLDVASEFNHRVPVRSISSDAEARNLCPAACARENGRWSGRWFRDHRGPQPAFYCGCIV